MLPSDAPFPETALALLALPFRPVTAGVLPAYAGVHPTLWSETRRLRHARRTSKIPHFERAKALTYPEAGGGLRKIAIYGLTQV